MTEQYLQDPTDEEKVKAVYENPEFKVFPYALTEYVFSCPQHAVFRIEASNGNKTRMAISSNQHWCAFSGGWQEVFDDFLVYARANGLVGNNLALADFFKKAPATYDRTPMKSSFDLVAYVREVEPQAV